MQTNKESWQAKNMSMEFVMQLVEEENETRKKD